MHKYRLFLFNQRSGLASEATISASDDAEAKRIMREKAKGAVCELWLGTRLVDFLGAAND